MRKRCHRRIVAPLPPRGLRPKLQPDQVRDLAMCHHINLDAIAGGTADEATLWQWVGSVLTWSRVAELLELGMPEMRQQLTLATVVLRRYQALDRIAFEGPEYGIARDGVEVMDQLAEQVDRPTAVKAADWSERQLNLLASRPRAEPAPDLVKVVPTPPPATPDLQWQENGADELQDDGTQQDEPAAPAGGLAILQWAGTGKDLETA